MSKLSEKTVKVTSIISHTICVLIGMALVIAFVIYTSSLK
jgi:hypothetical protein